MKLEHILIYTLTDNMRGASVLDSEVTLQSLLPVYQLTVQMLHE